MPQNDKPAPTDKEKLEAAIVKVARSLNEVQRVVEGATQLTPAQLQIAFTHLGQLLTSAHQKAVVSLSIAKISNGAFSLDALPEAPLAQPERIAGERMAGAARAPVERIAGSARHSIPADDDDVGFIDEA